MRKRTIAETIANQIWAMDNCQKSGNADWYIRHSMRLDKLMKESAPSGSGWDCGTQIDLQKSTPEKIIFTGSFHHMHESGMYDGWTDHTITVRPSFVFGIDVKISGRNRNDIKTYIGEIFHEWLLSEAPELEERNAAP